VSRDINGGAATVEAGVEPRPRHSARGLRFCRRLLA
jgi:hypothetical protein